MSGGHVVPALVAAALALLIAAEPVAAVTFAGTVTITSDGSVSSPGTLAVTGASTAVLAFEAGIWNADTSDIDHEIYVRRTSDGGKTWTTKSRVSTYGDSIAEWGTGYVNPVYEAGRPAIAASGQRVSLVFSEQYDLTPTYGIRYLGSTNGGRTWFEAGDLSTGDAMRPMGPAVARTTSNVAVAWTDGDTGAIWVAASSDGGDIFRAPRQVGSTTATPWQNRWNASGVGEYEYDGDVALAFGTGVLYATWHTGSRIMARRSTDGGRTWKTAVTMSSTPSSAGPTVVATGATAIVGFITDTGIPSIKRTTTSGVTWKARQSIAGSSPDAKTVLLNRTGSTWIALYERCLTSSCGSTAVYERKSTNGGSTWTTASRVTPSYSGIIAPGGAGVCGGRVLVMYGRHNGAESSVYTRRSST